MTQCKIAHVPAGRVAAFPCDRIGVTTTVPHLGQRQRDRGVFAEGADSWLVQPGRVTLARGLRAFVIGGLHPGCEVTYNLPKLHGVQATAEFLAGACESVGVGVCPPGRDLHGAPICVITYLGALAISGRLVSEVNLTRFSDAFGIFATNDDDWFDLTIEVDSNFGVDPFLIYQDDTSRWDTAHDHILEFFAVVFDCIRRSYSPRADGGW